MLLFNNYYLYQFLTNSKFFASNLKVKTAVGLFFFSIILSNLLSWTTIFSTTWLSGFVALIGAQYLGVQGSLLLLFVNILTLLFKTLPLFYSSLTEQTVLFYNVGDYAALTDNYYLQLQILLDAYSLSYIVLTNTIGLWALLFATNYMRGEPRILNFVYLLYFFLISMILLLASGNFPTLMLGWELIGCFSFLLINFWTTRIGTAKSAFKAFFFNKLSDASLILSFVILIIFLPYSFALNFSNLYLLQGLQITILNSTLNISHIFIGGIVVCSFCKSAQFGLHIWLPDSMEAPVPASALIHSATLVSAGIFLLGRHEILTSLNWLADFLIIWCSFTALYGGVVAAYQTDLKKILAYSTISHCGFLFLLVVYNNFYGLVLYLHLHGWFKSYSFMAAGNIISKYLGYQDYRRMGGSVNFTSIESLVLTISISCLGGLPFLLGFFNKHFLLLLAYEHTNFWSNIFTLGAAFTGLFYTLKTVYSLFNVNFKNAFFQKKNLINGLSSKKFWASEPNSNLILLGLYPLFIVVLALVVLSQNYWITSIVYHSTFGIFFFIIYSVLALTYIQNSSITTIISLVFCKLLYTLC